MPARAAGVPLIAPSIVTPLMLAGRLVVPSKPVLSPLAARLAWREVLEASRAAGDGFESRVAAVFGSATAIDARVRMRIAQRMQRLGSEIASAMLTFGAVVRHEAVAARPELAAKLAVLADFAARRDALLASVGAVDRDAALRDAARHDASAQQLMTDAFDRIVVLLADPEPVQRELLARLAERGVRVEVCVYAGAPERALVDQDGFPVKAAWEKRGFPADRLPGSVIRVGDGPDDCAQEVVAAVRAMSSEAGRPVTSDDVALMAPDAETRRALDRALALVGAPASAVESRKFSASRIGSLLERLAELVGDRSAESLAAFVRHDDIACWLERKAGVAGAARAVTEYRAETLLGDWQDAVVDAADAARAFNPVREQVQRLAAPLLAKQPARAWARPIRDVLAEVVGADSRGAFAGERSLSVRALDKVLVELSEVPAALATPIGCDEAIGLILEELGSKELRGDRHVDGLTILGWLDAGMTDERLLVLAGFADGLVPQGAPVDPIVPDDLRRQFGMPSGQRHAARDAWILDGILARTAARAGARTVFVVPRRTAEGDPLKPSRFLLRVADADLPVRAAHLFPTESGDARVAAVDPTPGAADFACTPPVPGANIQSVRVTAFKMYLDCPYLFQLSIDPRLRLEARDERSSELSVMGFGVLVHAALEAWGREEIGKGSPTTDSDQIAGSLGEHLDRFVAAHYPKSPVAALRVQVEIARRRLQRFARLQAEQAKEGWRIHAVELSFSPYDADGVIPPPHFPDGSGVLLTGRIDRVDFNERLGRFRALDYKTSSSGPSPTETHMKITGGQKARKIEWLDLQLPLYRVLLRSMPKPIAVGPCDLGYINLAPSDARSGFSFLEATDDDLAKAEELAREIVAKIRAGEFAPAEGVPLWDDDPLGPIWGVGTRAAAAVLSHGAGSFGRDGDA